MDPETIELKEAAQEAPEDAEADEATDGAKKKKKKKKKAKGAETVEEEPEEVKEEAPPMEAEVNGEEGEKKKKTRRGGKKKAGTSGLDGIATYGVSDEDFAAWCQKLLKDVDGTGDMPAQDGMQNHSLPVCLFRTSCFCLGRHV